MTRASVCLAAEHLDNNVWSAVEASRFAETEDASDHWYFHRAQSWLLVENYLWQLWAITDNFCLLCLRYFCIADVDNNVPWTNQILYFPASANQILYFPASGADVGFAESLQRYFSWA